MNLPGRTLSPLWLRSLRAVLGSLKLRITLGAIAGLVFGIGLSTAVLVRQAEGDTLSAQRQRELTEAARTARMLSLRVVDLQIALQATGTLLTPDALADSDRLAAFVKAQPVLRGLFTSIFVASRDGRVGVVADAAGVRQPDLNLSDSDYFRRTLAERRLIVSEQVPDPLSGEPVTVFTSPLRVDGKVFGVLGGALRLGRRDLLEDMVDGINPDAAALIVVTDAQGRILAHPARHRLMHSLDSEPRLSEAFAQWVRNGSPVEPNGLNLPQASELVSAAGVAGPDWMVWRATPQAELLAPLHAARRQALAWAAGLIGLLSLATLCLLWWLLRPLTQLEHRARHLFDGAHDPHAGWPAVGGELGRLALVLRHAGAERARLEAVGAGLLQKLGSVMAAAPVGIAFMRGRRFELVSVEFCHLVGRCEHELIGETARILYPSQADYDAIGSLAAQAFTAGQPYAGEWEMLRADGTRFWVQVRGREVDAGDERAGAIWTLNDVSEQIAERQRLEWSATHDVLTGLANRKALDLRLSTVFEAMPRSVPAAVLMIDLDHFKSINDSAGHAAGDAVLKAVAAAIATQIRASDLVVRLGGDEFAVLLERCASDVALRVAENVRTAIEKLALPWQEHVLRVGASVGMAALVAETRDAAVWLAAADAACYDAKANGRGAVRAAVRPLLRINGAVAE